MGGQIPGLICDECGMFYSLVGYEKGDNCDYDDCNGKLISTDYLKEMNNENNEGDNQ